MFEFLFSYPFTVFRKGTFVLLGGWPVWALGCLMLALAPPAWVVAVAAPLAGGQRLCRVAAGVIWGLESLMLALLLLLLWRPAMSVSVLKPQQNMVALVVDDSTSMGIEENGNTRLASRRPRW